MTSIRAQSEQLARKHQAELERLEEKAFRAFCKLRWPPDGRPSCPKCGWEKPYYYIRMPHGRRAFNCRATDCRHHFTALSGTVFAGSKLSYARLMVVIETVRANPSASLRSIGKHLGLGYRTMWLMGQKIREMDGDGINHLSGYKGYYQFGPSPKLRKRAGKTLHRLYD